MRLFFSFFLILCGGAVNAQPLTCKTLEARLITKLYNDDENRINVLFSPNGDFPSVNIITMKGSVIDDGYLWCDKTNDKLVELSINFSIGNIALPTKSVIAKDIVSDVICTLMNADTKDCDAIVMVMTKEAFDSDKGMDASLYLAPDDWKITAYKSETTIRFYFEPGLNSEIAPHEINLTARR